MNQIEYCAKLGTASDDEKKIIIESFWRECTVKDSSCLEVFSDNFKTNHLGTLSDNESIAAAKNRSGNAARNFTSTLLAKSDALALSQYVGKYIIPWVIGPGWSMSRDLAFRNYLIDKEFQSKTIKVSAAAGGGTISSEQIKPVIGIRDGLIIHYHGPSEYANEDYWTISTNQGSTIWKKK